MRGHLPTVAMILALAASSPAGCGSGREGGPDQGSLDLVGGGGAAIPEAPAPDAGPDATSIHERAFVVDLIQDLVFRKERDGWGLDTPGAHVNLEKLRRGGVDLLFSAIAPEPGRDPVASLEARFAAAEALVADTGGRAVMVSGLERARAERAAGRIPVMVLLEGADGLAGGLDRLHEYARRGLKVVGLVGPRGGPFGDPATAPRDPGGLTEAGAELVAACRDLGLVPDLTHASESVFWDVLAGQGSLAAVTHSACRALREHPRNLSDLQILTLARSGGVMGLVFNPELVSAGEGATLGDILAHAERVRALGAIDALAIGSDFGGIRPPDGLPDVAALPAFTRALLRAGFSAEEIEGVLGGNALRLIDAVERRQEPSAATGWSPERPIPVDCESFTGELTSGSPAAACDHDLLGAGPRLPPEARIRLRLRDMRREPARVEIFGEPGTPWQVEAQDLDGKVLVLRGVALDERGQGSLPMPAGRNLARIFLSPTRESHLREAVLWGR